MLSEVDNGWVFLFGQNDTFADQNCRLSQFFKRETGFFARWARAQGESVSWAINHTEIPPKYSVISIPRKCEVEDRANVTSTWP